jgi:hypothetical protein
MAITPSTARTPDGPVAPKSRPTFSAINTTPMPKKMRERKPTAWRAGRLSDARRIPSCVMAFTNPAVIASPALSLHASPKIKWKTRMAATATPTLLSISVTFITGTSVPQRTHRPRNQRDHQQRRLQGRLRSRPPFQLFRQPHYPRTGTPFYSSALHHDGGYDDDRIRLRPVCIIGSTLLCRVAQRSQE